MTDAPTEIKEEWDAFLKWIEEERHVSLQIYKPDYTSIKLWVEFNKSKFSLPTTS